LDWDIPSWATDHFVRQVIGEGIPPLMVKKIMMELIKNYE
jgi:DNA (cytosine-5)-methyltransferase 1